MTKILFICHGSICRSPMAEYILKDMVKRQKQDNEFVIDSCATSTEEIIGGVGNPIYPPAREVLKKTKFLSMRDMQYGSENPITNDMII